jgi:hypothetical protein
LSCATAADGSNAAAGTSAADAQTMLGFTVLPPSAKIRCACIGVYLEND